MIPQEVLTNQEATLTPIELAALDQHEATIEAGKETFLRVGHALREIKEARLYRGTHETFEAYCIERWGMSKQHAYRLINAMTTVEVIESNQLVTPVSESQVRPLCRLPVEDQADAWNEASTNGQPTAKQVEAVVNVRLHKARDVDQDEQPANRNPAPAKQAKKVKGILWKEAPLATCPRHEDGLHRWGDEDCEQCHEPKPSCREAESLYNVTRADIPLEARTKSLSRN